MIDNKIYDQILQLFVREKDDWTTRDWMSEPFISQGLAIATNSSMLATVPRWDGEYEKNSNADMSLPFPTLEGTEFSVSALKDSLSVIPFVDCFDEKVIECKACGSTGDVEFAFEWEGKEYDHTDECPVCEGAGGDMITSTTPNGKKEREVGKYVNIMGNNYNPNFLDLVVKCAEMLGETIIYITESRTDRIYLRVGEVNILIMKVQTDDYAVKIDTP